MRNEGGVDLVAVQASVRFSRVRHGAGLTQTVVADLAVVEVLGTRMEHLEYPLQLL